MSQHHNALIYTMVIVSAADREMTDAELRRMGQLVTILPVFRDFPVDDLPAVARDCAALLDDEDGLEKDAWPDRRGHAGKAARNGIRRRLRHRRCRRQGRGGRGLFPADAAPRAGRRPPRRRRDRTRRPARATRRCRGGGSQRQFISVISTAAARPYRHFDRSGRQPAEWRNLSPAEQGPKRRTGETSPLRQAQGRLLAALGRNDDSGVGRFGGRKRRFNS